MQLFKKEKPFSETFSPAWKSRSNFEHFQKEDYPHSLCCLGITDAKRSC